MDILTKNKQHTKIIDIAHINDHSFKLRLERNGLEFEPGQHVYLGFEGERASREYSIYSAKHEDYLDFLVKAVDDGKFSIRLKEQKPGDRISIQGPYGFFTLPEHTENDEFIFIASGTGIAPFHSIIMSNPGLNYRIIHGIRLMEDAYDFENYKSDKQVLCISREESQFYHGRVTDYLAENELSTQAYYYLCGNSAMIEDVQGILEERGINPMHIKTEVYF